MKKQAGIGGEGSLPANMRSKYSTAEYIKQTSQISTRSDPKDLQQQRH